MADAGILRFQRVVACCATISLATAAWVAMTEATIRDNSTVLLFLICFGVAGAVTGSAGRWMVRILGWLGGAASIAGFAMYLAKSQLSSWPFAVGSMSSLIGVILLFRSAPGPKAR